MTPDRNRLAPVHVTAFMNAVAPYRLPVFESLGSTPGVDLQVVFTTMRPKHQNWSAELNPRSFRYRFVRGIGMEIVARDWSPRVSPAIVVALRKARPDVVVIGGYSSPDDWLAWATARSMRIPMVVWFGTTVWSERSGGPVARGLKRLFLSRASAFVTYGSLATQYLLQLGIPSERIVTGCNVGDVAFFRSRVAELRASGHESPRRIGFLFVGQLIERKGIREVLTAFGHTNLDAEFHVAGKGPLAELVRDSAARDPRIVYRGALDREGLAALYARCDIMVIPSSREVFSIVCSEALASGLFTIASDKDGGAGDLILAGQNGLIIDPTDPAELQKALVDSYAVVSAGRVTRESITSSTPTMSSERYASAIRKAIRVAAADRSRSR
jgi:glycosyltransferase involved in cell wall biosynthesis